MTKREGIIIKMRLIDKIIRDDKIDKTGKGQIL